MKSVVQPVISSNGTCSMTPQSRFVGIKLQASEFSTRRKGSLDEIESKEQESIDSLATSNGLTATALN